MLTKLFNWLHHHRFIRGHNNVNQDITFSEL